MLLVSSRMRPPPRARKSADHRQSVPANPGSSMINYRCREVVRLTREHDTAFRHVACRGRRRLLKGLFDQTDYTLQRILKGFKDFIRVEREAAWNSL